MYKLKISILIVGIILNFISHSLLAHGETAVRPIIDIYRTTQLKTEDVYRRFDHELIAISKVINTHKGLSANKSRQLLKKLLDKLVEGIKKQGDFLYVQATPIFYPNDQQIHISLDIVDAKDKERVTQFLPLPKRQIHDPDHLIAHWQAYERAGFQMIYQTKQFPIYDNCPVHHCVFGFEDKKLGKYKDIFSTLVPKNKLALIDILQSDKSETKRASAAFLLAHLEDGKEVIKVLTPAIFDSSLLVRNNVMRVLGETLKHTRTEDFPIAKILQALDFPATTDRNKALMILFGLANQPHYANYLVAHPKPLLACLSLNQPNIHRPAYEILKKISRQQYSENEYTKWVQWAATQQPVA